MEYQIDFFIVSGIANIILLFCLFQPNIVYFIHSNWFSWKTETDEYKALEKEKEEVEKKMREIRFKKG